MNLMKVFDWLCSLFGSQRCSAPLLRGTPPICNQPLHLCCQIAAKITEPPGQISPTAERHICPLPDPSLSAVNLWDLSQRYCWKQGRDEPILKWIKLSYNGVSAHHSPRRVFHLWSCVIPTKRINSCNHGSLSENVLPTPRCGSGTSLQALSLVAAACDSYLLLFSHSRISMNTHTHTSVCVCVFMLMHVHTQQD